MKNIILLLILVISFNFANFYISDEYLKSYIADKTNINESDVIIFIKNKTSTKASGIYKKNGHTYNWYYDGHRYVTIDGYSYDLSK